MNFELQPHLTGTLIELRPLAAGDFDALYEAGRDPLIWEQHPERDRYKPDVFRRYFDGGMASGGAFAVIERATGRIIGSSRYCNLNAEAGEVEIGWTFLERGFWGGSYNREIKTLMLDHAFRFVDRVLFVVGEQNLRSRKALENIGARFLMRAENLAPEGSPPPHVIFVITRSQYATATLPAR